MSIVEPSQVTLPELFKKPLSIPPYQRDYCWRSDHVTDMLNDIFGRTTRYLMGTVILHRVEEYGKPVMHIIDGQQRLVTLTVLLKELEACGCDLRGCDPPLLNSDFSHAAANAILGTRKTIRDFLNTKEPNERKVLGDFLVGQESASDNAESRLLFSELQLRGDNALDLAYTFFDSINSKGKSLTDFDLLKAHHLMFIPSRQETLAARHNDDWLRRDHLHPEIFSIILRRLRMWCRKKDRYGRQQRPDYHEFLPVVEPESMDNAEHPLNRYMQPAVFRSWRREGDRIVLSMDYPLHDCEALIPVEIGQTIEGGDAFFLYANRYHGLYRTIFDQANRHSTVFSFVRSLALSISNIELRNAFRAIMLLYADKFGEDRLADAAVCIERIISQWRWSRERVRLDGTQTHVNLMQLVPILLDSVNTRHAFEQLHQRARSLPAKLKDALEPRRQGKPTNAQYKYWCALCNFYQRERSRLTDKRAIAILEFYQSADSEC